MEGLFQLQAPDIDRGFAPRMNPEAQILETGKSKTPRTVAEILTLSSHGLKRKLKSSLERGEGPRAQGGSVSQQHPNF
jgi:hypothetical protein